MSFSRELKDFVGGFKAGFDMGKPAKRTAADAKMEADEAERGVFKSAAGAIPDAPLPDAPAAPARTGKQPTFVELEKNITAQESGGNYAAVGPTHPKLGRALGYAQVMEANLPKWSQAAVGREVTADEFLKDPELQKKIVRHRLGGYYNQYGAEGAASMWFTGKPRPSGRKDSLGTVDHDYVRRAVGGRHAAVLPGQTAVLPVDDEPTIYAAEGGLIESPNAENTLVRGAAATGDEDDDYDPTPLVDVNTIAEMTNVGFSHLEKSFGLSKTGGIGEASRGSQDGIRAYALNVGAAKPEEVEQIKNTVDPKRKLPEEVRAIAGWKAVYDYHTKNGRPEAAARAASAMLMYSKQAAQMAGTMALAATEDGNKMAAAKAISSGYEALPDGQQLKVTGETPKGVKFQLVDETGQITEQGEATMDQMVKIATGMQNGTEWFRAANLLKSRSTTGAENKKRADARTAFEDQTTDDRDFVNTLTDEQRAAYLKMDPRDRREYAQRHERRGQEDAKAGRFEQRAATAAEKENYNRGMKAFLAAQRQGNWEAARETQMSQADRRLALFERDLSDRNIRHEESAADRKARYAEIDKRILERGTSGQVGGRLTAAEAREQRQRGALELGVDAIEAEKPGITASAGEEYGPAAADIPQRLEQVDDRAGTLRAQSSYERAVAENKRTPVEMDETDEAVGEWITTNKKDPKFRDVHTQLAAGIGRGNNVPTRQAIEIAAQAIDRTTPIKFQRDPRDPQGAVVKIGSNAPVRLGPDEINAIAMVRGGSLNPRQGAVPAPERAPDYRGASKNPDGAGPALPGVTGNPKTVLPRQVTGGLRSPLNQVQEEVAARQRNKWRRPDRALPIGD